LQSNNSYLQTNNSYLQTNNSYNAGDGRGGRIHTDSRGVARG
jgi:hypothetical protein